MILEVYTDGSATSGKPGGWAYVVIRDGNVKLFEGSGCAENVSNNDMELEAAVQGLAAVLKVIVESPAAFPNGGAHVTLVSDSQLVLGWASGRYKFKQENKLEKYNQLISLMERLKAGIRWVKGHSGNEFNERCDKLANEARLGVNRKKDLKAIEEGKTLIGHKKSGTVNVWYKNILHIIDFENKIVEVYDRTVHGPRGGIIEIREDKSR